MNHMEWSLNFFLLSSLPRIWFHTVDCIQSHFCKVSLQWVFSNEMFMYLFFGKYIFGVQQIQHQHPYFPQYCSSREEIQDMDPHSRKRRATKSTDWQDADRGRQGSQQPKQGGQLSGRWTRNVASATDWATQGGQQLLFLLSSKNITIINLTEMIKSLER